MSFGIKALFGLVGATAVATYLLVSAPTYVAVPVLVLFHIGITAVLLAGLVYGAGRLRAFCVGALVPAGATTFALALMLFVWLLAGPYEVHNFSELFAYLDEFAFSFRVWSAAAWIMSPIVGLLSVAARGALGAHEQPNLSKLQPDHPADPHSS